MEHIGAGLAAMFPGLPAADVGELAQLPSALREALAVDGPSVVSVECSADEIPPFAPFLTALEHSAEAGSAPAPKENAQYVAARA